MAVSSFTLSETAGVFDNLPAAIPDDAPRSMESYDQGHGCIVYRTTLPAGPAAVLSLGQVNDFGWVFLDGKEVGVTDRRSRKFTVRLPERKAAARLDILVEAMGHVNFGKEIHDRKGIEGRVELVSGDQKKEVAGPWSVYPLKLDAPLLGSLKWATGGGAGPGFWRGSFNLTRTADTFLDLRQWGKGVVWVNGHCLARYWNIGPTQTAYLPGAWLKTGANEVVVLDLTGPREPVMAGLEKPIPDELHPEFDFARKETRKGMLALDGHQAAYVNAFKAGAEVQEVTFPVPLLGSQFMLEARSAQNGKSYASLAELDLLDAEGKSLSHANWTIAYADSEELTAEDGSASNAINGQTADFWHTEWKNAQPGYPHFLLIDLGAKTKIGGFRYTPRQGNDSGRIKDYGVYVGDGFLKE
jgi:beta-galactosidase